MGRVRGWVPRLLHPNTWLRHGRRSPCPANLQDRACHPHPLPVQALLDCHILDTPDERRFDAVTRLLASVFRAPVAVVGLIDRDRLWLKSLTGLDGREGAFGWHLGQGAQQATERRRHSSAAAASGLPHAAAAPWRTAACLPRYPALACPAPSRRAAALVLRVVAAAALPLDDGGA